MTSISVIHSPLLIHCRRSLKYLLPLLSPPPHPPHPHPRPRPRPLPSTPAILRCTISSLASPTFIIPSSPFMASTTPATSFNDPPGYTFTHHRLHPVLRDPSKQPVVLVACGSFSPVTYLHLRMFEMARDYARHNTDFEIVGGYLSPVSDQYKKPGLLAASHRVHMCSLATEETSNWLMVDPWEAFQTYQRTAVVLDHFDYEINTKLGGVTTPDGEQRNVRILLLAGSDLIATMTQPGVWLNRDLDHILGRYGTMIIERAGTDTTQALDNLARWKHNIHLIHQLIQNDVSSTKVRLFLRRGLSVRYLLPNSVVDYIEDNGLYVDDGPNASAASGVAIAEKEKEKEREREKEREKERERAASAVATATTIMSPSIPSSSSSSKC